MAFPEIFLNGIADLNADRPLKIEMPDWLRHILWAGDQRAARHKVFPFVAFSMLQRHRSINQGSYFVHSRVDGNEANSLEDLTERVVNGDNSLAQAVFFWGSNITGSDAHLASLKREIDAIITHQLTRDEPNPPSLFLSGSCAEFHWNQLLSYLSKHVCYVEGDGADDINALWAADPTGDDFRALRRQKLNEYAHVVTTFFEQRAHSFIKDVLVPALGIDIFYVIFEFAEGRGQIHFHLLAWLKRDEKHNLHKYMHRAMPATFGGADAAAAEQA
eukprot:2741938-Prymnesium_polylepis.1